MTENQKERCTLELLKVLEKFRSSGVKVNWTIPTDGKYKLEVLTQFKKTE